MPSRYSADNPSRPASFPRNGAVTIRGGEKLQSLSSPDAGRPQATPPCCLGSLALGQPCAEAVERDVLLAEGGMGHQVPRQTVPRPPPWLPPPGVEGAGSELRGSLHERGKDRPGPRCSALEPWHLGSSSCQQALSAPSAHLAPLLWFGSRLLFNEAFPQSPGTAGGQDEASEHLPLLRTCIPGLRLS